MSISGISSNRLAYILYQTYIMLLRLSAGNQSNVCDSSSMTEASGGFSMISTELSSLPQTRESGNLASANSFSLSCSRQYSPSILQQTQAMIRICWLIVYQHCKPPFHRTMQKQHRAIFPRSCSICNTAAITPLSVHNAQA